VVTRLSNQHDDIGVRPYNFFTDTLRRNDAARFKDVSLPTYKSKTTGAVRALVRLPEGTMQVKLKGRGSNRALNIREKGGVTSKWFLDTPQTLMQRLGGSREALPQGQFYTVRIGGNRPFRNVFASRARWWITSRAGTRV